jgi:hypothetical protein
MYSCFTAHSLFDLVYVKVFWGLLRKRLLLLIKRSLLQQLLFLYSAIRRDIVV